MKVRDECGVIGVVHGEAFSSVVMGLQALQHRGQESAGAASFDGQMHVHKAMGLVDSVFTNAPHLPGSAAIGHNRYSTCGSSSVENAGPFTQMTDLGPIALAHNGNIVNAPALSAWMEREHGIAPQSSSDSELLAILLKLAPGNTWDLRIKWMAGMAIGSYSLVILTQDAVLGVRDPMGNRPLALGHWEKAGVDDGWVLSSESCAFSLIGAKRLRDVVPGEIIELRASGIQSLGVLEGQRHGFCAFEYIYIARPDTVIGERTVHEVRRSIGEELGREHPVEADIVIAVPDSGTSAALGYATTNHTPFGEGLIKNRYVGRTFIHPTQSERERLIRMKFGVLPLNGQRVVIVDDSIVRGNTLKPIVTLLREAGAAEIHVRIAAPPIYEPCYLGVDMASREELIANRLDERSMGHHFGADSVKHVSIDGLLRAIRGSRSNTCLACFTGEYPLADTVSTLTSAREPVGASV